MTLVEVVVAATLFVIVMGGVLSAMLFAYRTSVETRYRDRAFNVLKTVADQFQNSKIYEAGSMKTLFAPAETRTGEGLVWHKKLNTFIYPAAASSFAGGDVSSGTSAGLTVSLGTAGDASSDAIPATVYRTVRYIANPTGISTPGSYSYISPQPTNPVSNLPSTGYLLEAVFEIEFQLPTRRGANVSYKTVVLRHWNRSDL